MHACSQRLEHVHNQAYVIPYIVCDSAASVLTIPKLRIMIGKPDLAYSGTEAAYLETVWLYPPQT